MKTYAMKPAEAEAQPQAQEMVEEMLPLQFLLDFPLFGLATASRAELGVVEQAGGIELGTTNQPRLGYG